MHQIDLVSVAHQVVGLAFGLGIVFGAIAQRTHFCTMGALTDVVYFGDWNRMRQWILAMAVAILGTTLLSFFGWIDISKSLYTGMRLNWLSHLVGGACFGIGMVLASGCGNKTLVRIGSGNLKSLIVFLIMGLTAFMTLKGVLAIPRTVLLDSQFVTLATTQDLPAIASAHVDALGAMKLIVGGIVTLLLLVFVFGSRAFRARDVVVNNLLAGVVVGCVIVAAWFVSGNIGHLAEHPDTLQEAYLATNSGRMESFSFVAPVAYTLDLLMMWTDTSKAVTFGIAATLGVIAGSFVVAMFSGTFRWEGFGNVEDVANHLIGGSLMGFGGVTALGCTVGQGLSGMSTLSLGSMLTVIGILAGGILATRYQSHGINA